MTDTIGWGAVDVEPERRRRHRRLTRLAWPLAAVVVAGFAVSPVVNSHLSDGSARWLLRQWATQTALADARETTLQSVVDRLGIGDGPTYLRLIHQVDAQVADRLTSLQRAVRAHRVWGADVSAARTSVDRAIAGEEAAFRHEAVAGRFDFSVTSYVPTPLAGTAQTLLQQTTDLLARLADRHHLHAASRPVVRLDAGQSLVAQLHQLTDRPVGLQLVLAQSDGLSMWNLRTGEHRALQSALLNLGGGGSIPLIGSDALLVLTDAGYAVVPLDGKPLHRLPAADIYTPDGRGQLWQVRHDIARRVTVTGRPVGSARRLPFGYGIGGGPVTDLVVLQKLVPVAGAEPGLMRQQEFLWRPDNGRLTPVPDSCSGETAATPTAYAYVSCDQRHLILVDERARHRQRVTAPPGTVFGGTLVLSADGSSAAVETFRMVESDVPWHLLVVSLATGATATIQNKPHVDPVAWAPDGSSLVLAASPNIADCCPETGTATLAYWTPGMPDVAAIRIQTSGVRPQFAVLLS